MPCVGARLMSCVGARLMSCIGAGSMYCVGDNFKSIEDQLLSLKNSK